MKNSTKILVLLLTLALAFSVLTVLSFAEAAPSPESSESSNDENGEEVTEPIKVKFTTENFITALNYLWQGMLCIFIVIGVLVLVTYGLNKASNYATSNKSKNSD